MTSGYQNLHTHTNYCDGKISAGEMVLAAIARGAESIGFSEHSHLSFEDSLYAISLEDIPKYINEINTLKVKYAGQIDIYLGMEIDYYTEDIPQGLDFVIGCVHFIQKNGEFITIDNTYDTMLRVKDEYFEGDFLLAAESYYETIAGLIGKTDADIIGHFDIIAKQNKDNRLFDASSSVYIDAALAAMDKLLESGKPFEINTGAMYRNGNRMQYPSDFLLRELKRRGGEIVLSSDSHDAGSLFFKFDEMRELAKSCGFKYAKKLTKTGFVDWKL